VAELQLREINKKALMGKNGKSGVQTSIISQKCDEDSSTIIIPCTDEQICNTG